MFSLLTSPGIGRPVSAVILKAVESLLEGEEDHEEEPPQKKRRTGWLNSRITVFNLVMEVNRRCQIYLESIFQSMKI